MYTEKQDIIEEHVIDAIAIFDETGSKHDNAKDDTLNKGQSYNTPQIHLTDKNKGKA